MSDIEELESLVNQLEKGVARLKKVSKSLEALDPTVRSDFSQEVEGIRKVLTDPGQADEAERRLQKLHQSIEKEGRRRRARRLFEEGVALGQQGGTLLEKGMHKDAQARFQQALDKFKEAMAVVPSDDSRFVAVISANQKATRANLLFARLSEALEPVGKGQEVYEQGHYDEAERLFNRVLAQVEEVAQHAHTEGLTNVEGEALRHRAELLQNIEACQVARDAKKVEDLAQQATSLASQAERAIDEKRLPEARDKLEEARQALKQAFDLATHRNFQDSLTGINRLRQRVEARLDDIYRALEAGVSEVAPRREPVRVSPPRRPRIAVPQEAGAALEGEVWEERYERVRLIGQGGYADVYLARRKKDGALVALKLPRGVGAGQTLSENLLAIFHREAENWQRLVHPHIVRLYEYGLHPYPWLAMEYMPGGSLAPRLGQMGLREALHICITVCSAVEYAHKGGLTHRDIKPANILFSQEGEPKLSDWGLARHFFDPTYSGQQAFTPLYCAPEQVQRDAYGSYDHPGDVFQLGLVFYHLLTGQHPFVHKGEDLTTLNPLEIVSRILDPSFPIPHPTALSTALPKALDTILLTCLKVKPSERYREVWMLREALEEVSKPL